MMKRAWCYLTFACAGMLWFVLFPVSRGVQSACDALASVVDDAGRALGVDDDAPL